MQQHATWLRAMVSSLFRKVGWAALAPALGAAAEGGFPELERAFGESILPLMEQHCLECHDAATRKGELDLERFNRLAEVRKAPEVWQHILEQMEMGEMPPRDAVQPTSEEKQAWLAWIRDYLNAEALARAGDPGPVVLRRLNHAELTYTVQDLTGVASLQPAQAFPVESAAGEGFINVGDALSMSPALLEKYLEAGKEVARHAVLLPGGFRFSPHTLRRDWAEEAVEEVRRFYRDILQVEAIDFAYRSQVGAVEPQTLSEGRVNLTPYFQAFVKHRETLEEEVARAEALAAAEGLNPKYFRILAECLTKKTDEGGGFLQELRQRWRQAATPEAAEALAAWVRQWQDRLWKFNPVGHLGGYVHDWQEAVDPVVARHELQLALPSQGQGDAAGILLSLAAGTAGDGADGDYVRWERPRLVQPGQRPVLLRDVPAAVRGFHHLRKTTFEQIDVLLGIAFRLRSSGEETPSIDAVADEHAVNATALRAVLEFLGVGGSEAAPVGDYLTLRRENVGGQSAISGWGLGGEADLSLLGNASDAVWRIPGEVPPHAIVVHPMPRRWVAAGWKSPGDMRIEVRAHAQDRHHCGNGIEWSLWHSRGGQERELRSGVVQGDTAARIDDLAPLEVLAGDLLSLRVDARDQNHACDLTEIELSVGELGGAQRSWSLSGDCADRLLEGNPHPDGHGHLDTWHFFSRSEEGAAHPPTPWSSLPEGSLLANWEAAETEEAAARWATRLKALLAGEEGANAAPVNAADKALRTTLVRANGPLFGRVTLSEWVALGRAITDGVRGGPWPQAVTERFDARGNLRAKAPSVLRFSLPAQLFAGAELFVSGEIESAKESASGSVQLELRLGENVEVGETLHPEIPVTVLAGSVGEQRVREMFRRFREVFPAAMCYARVVPIDEVVTLVLYHREDEHLKRLMLDERQEAVIDRLWDELMFVSHDAFRLQVALEQILEFATQDADPAKFTPMLQPVAEGVTRFERRLVESEPRQLDALVDFAAKVYRRPLTLAEAHGLRALYHRLREDGLSHEAGFRMTLARLFASPAFLYRAEEPVAGPTQGPVSGWEQASRLSYFLWSSAPDERLRDLAAEGRLSDPGVLVKEARRMLGDDRARRLAEHFACQWLHLRDFDELDEKNERLFPEFAKLRGSMYEEALRFFADLFQNNRSVLSILDADHAFLNAELASFYGVAWSDRGVAEWRRMAGMREEGRGGVLGMAAALAKHSGASRSSPVLRGTWITETLLGERLPKPPNDVPQLPEEVPQGLSARELIERHRAEPACARCHVRIDPFGFALERFDTVGRARRELSAGDTRSELPDGTVMEGLEGLRRYLLQDRREDFLRQFCRKLLGYALGRAVQLSDQPLIDEMIGELKAAEHRVQVAIDVVVRSAQFREIRGEDSLPQ